MWCHLIQMTSQAEPERNIAWLQQQLAQLPQSDTPQLVILPECGLCFGSEGGWARLAEPDLAFAPDSHAPMQQAMSQLAQAHNLYLVAGTLPICAEDGRAYASCLVYGPQGQRLGRYDKIHLFDVDLPDNTRHYRESTHTHPGSGLCVVDLPIGRLGLAVCYDLRFAELFRGLVELGAEIIALPAAFTMPTGEAHWEVLVRARAIENQCYLLACAQQGQHDNDRQTWGHSMIVTPWGEIAAQLPTGTGRVSAQLDPHQWRQCRQTIPVLQHRRLS